MYFNNRRFSLKILYSLEPVVSLPEDLRNSSQIRKPKKKYYIVYIYHILYENIPHIRNYQINRSTR